MVPVGEIAAVRLVTDANYGRVRTVRVGRCGHVNAVCEKTGGRGDDVVAGRTNERMSVNKRVTWVRLCRGGR